MKTGKMSTPGMSSSIDIIPNHLNINMLPKIPPISSISPKTGSNRIATIYSLTSRIMHNTRNSISISLNTIYLGTSFC